MSLCKLESKDITLHVMSLKVQAVLEKSQTWVKKIASSAHVICKSFTILAHDVCITLNTSNQKIIIKRLMIIIIINSYTFVTLIKSTHEKLYAIYIEWTKLSEIENYSLFIQLLHAVETIIMRLCIKLVHVDCMLKNEWLSHFKLL